MSKRNSLIFSIITYIGFTININANCSSNTIGSTTFFNCDNGTSGSATKIGGTTFFNFSDGTSGSATKIGGTTFFNFSN